MRFLALPRPNAQDILSSFPAKRGAGGQTNPGGASEQTNAVPTIIQSLPGGGEAYATQTPATRNVTQTLPTRMTSFSADTATHGYA